MLRALFCVLAAFFRAAAALRQVLIFHKIQNLEDDHMGFRYAREKKKFNAEWAKTAAWYKAEGMPDEGYRGHAPVRLGGILQPPCL